MWVHSFLLLAGLQATLCAGEDNRKELIMLEIEPIVRDDRIKRSSEDAAVRLVRQSQTLPPEYLNFLQQLNQQQAAGAPQQPQQQPGGPSHQPQLIQQYVVARDGKQSAAARYVFSPDGRIVQEGAPEPQQPQHLHQQHYVRVPQAVPQSALTDRPIVPPALDAFSRAQTQLQQDYHDAPIRAQIAGVTERPDPVADTLRSPPPAGGPGSAAPQIFSQAAAQAIAQQEARLRNQFQDPAFAGQYQLVDPNAYYQQLAAQQQQQFLHQPQIAPQPQSVASADTGRQLTNLFEQAPRQRVVYQQAQPQSQPQLQPAYTPKLPKQPTPIGRRPIGSSSQAQLSPSTDPQLAHRQSLQARQPQPQFIQQQALANQQQQAELRQQALANQQQADIQQQVLANQQHQADLQQLFQQDFHQQYLVETTRPAAPQPQPQQPQPAIRYVQQAPQPQPQTIQQSAQSDDLLQSLFSNPGRGLFSPAFPEKTSRSSLYLTRPSRPTPSPAPTQEALPTVRIPSPSNQRALSRAEYDALVEAGYSITPVGSEEPQASLLKAKRAPINLPSRNHVIYQNQQDGVSYQYSPGSSEYNPAPKVKRYAPAFSSSTL